MASSPKRLGPFKGRYAPDYQLKFWKDGDPRAPITGVDLRSVVAIQTSKSIEDVSGTFTITLKDRRALSTITEMDVVRIKLFGHDGEGPMTVFRGVVDTARAAGSADQYASRDDVVIEGRCLGKYLQICTLFLPVWDPVSALPTALTFGRGRVFQGDKQGPKVGTSPKAIFKYLVDQYVYGKRKVAGVSGVPNSRFWINPQARFDHFFDVPYIQFDEDAVGDALKRLEVVGYSEAWIDEVGNVVYRHPPWDKPVSYDLHTNNIGPDWNFARSDVGCATYIEVIPAGLPGIASGQAQALMAGRAPVPSSYVKADKNNELNHAGKEFIIDTDAKGIVTAKGEENYWRKRQRRLGVRPQQITSPLLVTQKQAQAQAEGLLRFYCRMIKTGQIAIPGCPSIRLGTNFRIHGPVDGIAIDRTYYCDTVGHTYVETDEGGDYSTRLGLSHGRDPWDPQWKEMVIPKYDPKELAREQGILLALQGPSTTGASATGVAALSGNLAARIYQAAMQIVNQRLPYVWGGGHSTIGQPNGGGFDCSGFVSAVMHAVGLLNSPLVSGSFSGFGQPGKGAQVTIWSNSGHVWMEIDGPTNPNGSQYIGTGSAGNSGGPCAEGMPSAGYIAGFTPTHPPGA